MALFGKSTAESHLKRLQADSHISTKDLAEILDYIRFTPDFSVDQHPWLFSHAQKKVREFAAAEVKTPVSGALVASIARNIAGKSGEIRRDMAATIVKIAPERIGPLLDTFLTSTDLADREIGVDLISGTPDFTQHLGHLKAGLRDPDVKIRQRVVRILIRDTENATITLILRELLHDDDPVVRHLVIEALAKNPTAEIIEPFFHRIAHEGPDTRAVMLTALQRLMKGSQRHIERELMPILADENPAVREIAVKLLGELPDQQRVLRSFLIHIGGLASWLRERSIASIRTVSHDLVPALIELVKDEEPHVRLGALQVARTVTDRRMIPPIRDYFLSDRDWWERSLAAEILGNFETPEVTAALLQRIEDRDLRYSVIPALGAQKTPEAMQALIGCLKDPARGIRISAMEALREMRAPEVVAAIQRTGLADKELEVRLQAASVLRSLQINDEVLFNRLESGPKQDAVAVDVGLEMVNDSLN